MKKKKPKVEEEKDVHVLLTELFVLRKERKELETAEKKVSEALIKATKPNEVFLINMGDEQFEGRHETAETPVINPDINWVRKKVGALFDKIIKVSVSDARAAGGQVLIDSIKIGTNTSHSIKFYKTKEGE